MSITYTHEILYFLRQNGVNGVFAKYTV